VENVNDKVLSKDSIITTTTDYGEAIAKAWGSQGLLTRICQEVNVSKSGNFYKYHGWTWNETSGQSYRELLQLVYGCFFRIQNE
jgi:hypothetical protein